MSQTKVTIFVSLLHYNTSNGRSPQTFSTR